MIICCSSVLMTVSTFLTTMFTVTFDDSGIICPRSQHYEIALLRFGTECAIIAHLVVCFYCSTVRTRLPPGVAPFISKYAYLATVTLIRRSLSASTLLHIHIGGLHPSCALHRVFAFCCHHSLRVLAISLSVQQHSR